MLRKLLKYDLRAIFRYWWIAAVVSVVISIAGGFCGRVLNTEQELPWAITLTASLGMAMAAFCSVALLVLTLVLIFIRFYRNFFTDEGYLTFTLPVSRRTLLLSKVISGTVGLCVSGAVCVSNLLLMVSISEAFTHREVIEEVVGTVQPIESLYSVLYFAETVTALVLFALSCVLFLYVCITFASMIVKKGRLIAAIGIYYGASNVVYGLIQMFLLFGSGSIGTWLERVPNQTQYGVNALMILVLILFIGIICCILYILQQLMLERKLNLS